MRRIAITGHRGLSEPVAREVEQRLRSHLAQYTSGLIGMSCLADGADALFAAAVLDLGGELEAVVPAERYREGLPADHHGRYDALFARASRVHRMPFAESEEHAHMAASRHLVDRSEELVAVWDGRPAQGYGGTADVVGYAKAQGRRLTVIWPPGARR